jgi:hypothetical protein
VELVTGSMVLVGVGDARGAGRGVLVPRLYSVGELLVF